MHKPRLPGTPDERFRSQIESAVAEGADRDALVLRLTLRDVTLLTRDPATPLADISYKDGVMRFLGVRVERGGVTASTLEPYSPAAAAEAALAELEKAAPKRKTRAKKKPVPALVDDGV